MQTNEVVCPWCSTVYPQFQPNCSNCGGVLPRRDSRTAGDPPPPPPRQLPSAFVSRARRSGHFELLFGAIFAGVGAFVGIILTTVSISTGEPLLAGIGLPISLLFVLIGGIALWLGRRRSSRLLHALTDGIPANGTVEEVYLDTTISMNGRSPWRVSYSFVAGGIPQEGSARTFHRSALMQAGDPVFVVYDANNPGVNSLYPPLP